MDEREWLAERFEEHRTRLRAVAYRMLGSLSEADDAVQEAWLRLSRTDAGAVENLGGWLTTVVARVSLNMLRSRDTRREEPLDVRLPDPIVDRADGTDPEHEALLADSVGLALLVVLETLSPGRAARVRAARHVRRAVRRDRADRRPLPRRGAPARQPRPPPRPGRARRPRRRPRRAARGRRRVPRRRARRRLRGAARRARPRRRAAGRRRRRPGRAEVRGAEAVAGQARMYSQARPATCGRRSSTAPRERSRCATASRSRSGPSRSAAAGSSQIDFLADPERLRALDLTVLDG